MKSLVKGLLFFLIVVAVALTARHMHLEDILSPEWAETHILDHGFQGTVTYIGIVASLSAFGVPRQVLSILGGYVFGALLGAVWVSVGLILGCTLGFFLARILGQEVLQRRFGKRVARIEKFLRQSPFAMGIAIRLLPAGNNALTTMLAGITTIPALPFILGSGLGYLPQNIIFTLLGSGIRIDPLWRIGVSVILFVIASFVGYAVYKRYAATAPTLDDDTQDTPCP